MPDTLKILTVFDIHMSDQTPGYRVEGYGADILRKLWETVEIAKREQATHVLWMGDVFDNKDSWRTSHRSVQAIADVLEAYELPVMIVPGNHDLAPGGLLESIAKQPIGILGRLSNVTLLGWDPLVLDEDVTLFPIPGVPIIQEENWVERYVTGSKVKRPIIVSHQLIAKDPSTLPFQARESFQDSKKIAQHTDACLVLSGDIHQSQGTFIHENGRGGYVGFSNLGSTCRMTAREMEHKPHVLLLTIEDDERRTLKFDEIPLTTVRPAEEVYRVGEYAADKAYQADINETIKKLTSTPIHRFSIDAVAEEVMKNDTVEPEVREKAIELIEFVR